MIYRLTGDLRFTASAVFPLFFRKASVEGLFFCADDNYISNKIK